MRINTAFASAVIEKAIRAAKNVDGIEEIKFLLALIESNRLFTR